MIGALSGTPQGRLVILLLALCAYPLGRCHGAQAERERSAAATLSLERRNGAEHGRAADRRLRDSIQTQSKAKEREDAYRVEPDARPSDARRRFNCERLRQSGADISRFSACGRPAGAGQAPA